MMLCLLSDDMPAAGRLARRWLQEGRTTDPFMCASAGSATMAAQREMFSCEGVATSTRMLHDRFVEGGARYGVVFHQSIAGSTFAVRGDLDGAQEALEIALQTAVELHGERSALYNMPALLLADIYYERNQLRLVEEILAQRDITANLGFVDNLVAGFLTSARLLALRARHEEADTLLEEGEWLATQSGFPRMHASLFHERLRMLQALGRSQELASLVRASSLGVRLDAPPTPADGVVSTDLLLAMAAARLRLAEGTAREAAALLRPWYAYARQRHCHRPAIACGVLLARATAAGGERRGAQRVLRECLQMGELGGFMRSFIDEGAEVQALLADMRSLDGAPGQSEIASYLATILRAGDDPDRRPAPATGETGPSGQALLSQRELQILNLAAQGNQNQDIAAALFLAESTVKWYWQRIFDKLDVRRRPDAIRLARQLHWIA
jgi:LuxR family maltose regulon positive regulatory protein